MRIILLMIMLLLLSFPVFSADTFAAKINGEDVPLDKFNTVFDSAKKQLSGHELMDFNSEEGKTLLMATKRSILDELIDHALLRQGAQQLSVIVSEQEIEDRIKKVQKEFPSKAVFSDALSEDNISPEDLHQGISQELLVEKITDKLGGNIKVNESEIETFFNKNKELFSQPKRVQVIQILVATEKEAQDLLDKLAKGADFKELAKKYTLDQESRADGGDLGFIEEAQLPSYAAEPLKTMISGDISKPLKAEEGYYLIRCGEILDKKETDMSGSREQIKSFLVQEKKRAIYERWFEHLKDKAQIEINPELFQKDAPKIIDKKPLDTKNEQPKTSDEKTRMNSTPVS